MPKNRILFCLVDIKKRSLLTSCVLIFDLYTPETSPPLNVRHYRLFVKALYAGFSDRLYVYI